MASVLDLHSFSCPPKIFPFNFPPHIKDNLKKKIEFDIYDHFRNIYILQDLFHSQWFETGFFRCSGYQTLSLQAPDLLRKCVFKDFLLRRKHPNQSSISMGTIRTIFEMNTISWAISRPEIVSSKHSFPSLFQFMGERRSTHNDTNFRSRWRKWETKNFALRVQTSN